MMQDLKLNTKVTDLQIPNLMPLKNTSALKIDPLILAFHESVFIIELLAPFSKVKIIFQVQDRGQQYG